MTAFLTLFHKELLRFWKVSFQTVLAPMVSTLLYLLIFLQVLDAQREVYPGIPYTIVIASYVSTDFFCLCVGFNRSWLAGRAWCLYRDTDIF